MSWRRCQVSYACGDLASLRAQLTLPVVPQCIPFGTPSPAPKVWIACLLLPLTAGTSEEDRKRLLTFVVVGGGPTGVEFAGAAHSLPDNRSCAG